MEGISPTGSFKDRGAATAITTARAAGARTVIEDSSGNAGTAIAAYAAAAGLRARIFAPDDIVAAKARAIEVLGAELIKVSGPRSAVTAAAVAAATDAYDAGHARDDAFVEGTEAIERAWRQAASQGLLMEPTSAAAIAGARVLNLPPGAVVIITGSGLKAIDRY